MAIMTTVDPLEKVQALLADKGRIRRFRKGCIPDAIMESLLEAAHRSSMGLLSKDVGVVAYRTTDAVMELARDTALAYRSLLKFFDNRPGRFLMKCVMKRSGFERMNNHILPLGREIVASLDDGVDKVLHGAPAAMIFTHSIDTEVSSVLITCACAILAAEDMGLQCCLIGCLPPVLAIKKTLIKKHRIPPGQIPAIALILGYPAQIVRKGRRKTHSDAMQQETVASC